MTPEQAAAIKAAALDWLASVSAYDAAMDAVSTAGSDVNTKKAAVRAAMLAAGVTQVWGSGYLLTIVGTELDLDAVPTVD